MRSLIRPRVVKRSGGGAQAASPPHFTQRMPTQSVGYGVCAVEGAAAIELAARPTPLPPSCSAGRSPSPASRGRMKVNKTRARSRRENIAARRHCEPTGPAARSGLLPPTRSALRWTQTRRSSQSERRGVVALLLRNDVWGEPQRCSSIHRALAVMVHKLCDNGRAMFAANHESLRTRLAQRQPLGVFWMSTGNPAVIELAAASNPDAIVLDAQHGLWDRQTIEYAVGAARPHPPVLGRTAENSPIAIGQALDAGAEGVIVPLIEDEQQAAEAVAAARFPPHGVRSAGGV